MHDDDLITYAIAADMLRMPQATLRSLVRRRAVPHVRLTPKLVRFSKRELAAWLAGHRVEATAA